MKSRDEKKPAIGIDLGTTNSLAAFSGRDGIMTLDGQRGAIVPSVISFSDGELLIGHPAKEAMLDNPEQTVYSIKRLMGKSAREFGSDDSLPFRVVPDPRGLASVEINGRLYSPVELSAEIIKEVKRQAEKALGSAVDQAVITVPAYFDDAQRQATRDAGKIAGLDVMRIINEPTAAALAYGLDKKDRGNIVVYDLGGGTFDVSILRLENGIFEVLSTAGDTRLGGDDFDKAIIEYIVTVAAARDITLDLSSPRTAVMLKQQAEKAKIALSKTDTVSIPISSGENKSSLALSRIEFEKLISHLLRRTLKLCRQTLEDAGLSRNEIDEVILVGGSTRIPYIKNAVADLFACNTHSDLGPDEVVARGAAIQAEILTGGRDDLLLLDVTPLSLGIEMMGGVMSSLVKRNGKVPAVAREVFTTYVDGQTSVAITVFQGERELVADNRRLGNFTLTGIDPQPAGAPRIEVSFMLDADGILKVSARDVKSGKEQAITIHPTYGLARDSIDKMVRESFVNAREDINRRLFIELSQEAEKVIAATEKAFELFERIGKTEKEDIENSILELKDALEGDNSHLLREMLDNLNDSTSDLASRMAGDAFSEALSEKSVEEAKGLIE